MVPAEETSSAAGPRTHWTYVPSTPGTGLCQGDLLKKTDALRELLAKVHPHYLKDDYTHFIVLTQSCDLVRRAGEPCKSRYISLGAVRPLDLVVRREIEAFQRTELERRAGACGQKYRSALLEFLRKLFNNNERDFFYLHEDVAFGLAPSSCAFLQLSIAIRASEHYDKCIDARIGSLQEIFRAKLGWLVGNLYSRVGTEDWVPEHETKAEFNERLSEVLEDACWWVDDEQLRSAVKNVPPDLANRSREELQEHIRRQQVKTSKRDRVLAAIERVLVASGIEQGKAGDCVAAIRADTEVSGLLPK